VCAGLSENLEQKEHSSWLHPAISHLLKEQGVKVSDLNAIAVTEGPGSYTGLRVGLAAAKGICYALKIPLITENTLKVMAFAAIGQSEDNEVLLFCPMIDARRMEVFTAIFNRNLEERGVPVALELTPDSFPMLNRGQSILFFGSGSGKWRKICHSPLAGFPDFEFNAGSLGKLSYAKFLKDEFTDVVYSQPAYIKDFHTYNKN
jgi:tRNA threonylcarbamoyladenosine biosynthesis protein TsaB